MTEPETTANPFTTPAAQQVKAILGLIVVVLTAVGVSYPDSGLVKLAIGVVGAVVGYLGIFQASNAKPKSD